MEVPDQHLERHPDMKHKDTKLSALHRLPLFARCTTKELEQIAALGDMVTVPPARALLREGGRPDEAYVVVSGEAVVSRAENEIARVGAGELLGEISVIDRSPTRTATVTAATEMELLVFTPRAFSSMLEAHPEVKAHVTSTSAERQRLLGDAPST